jgi:4-aminobutyrate aminotransferase-like enzyme
MEENMSKIGPSFLDDPKYLSLRDQLLAYLAEKQADVSSIKEADLSIKQTYNTYLDAFSQSRGGNIWHPYLSSGLGNGAYVKLADGSVKLDFISGIGSHWGHSLPELVSASIDAAMQDTVMQGNLQQDVTASQLYSRLTSASGLDHCFATTSGAMAAENALKIAFHHFAGKRKRILAFEKCFMGRTLALSQVTDNAAYRDGLPQTVNVDYIPFFDNKDPKGSTNRAVTRLKKHLTRFPKQHAVMCMELIQGEGGYFGGDTSFFKALISVLREHGVLVIVDEIQTFGRTENLFAFQTFGLQKDVDIVTVGKLSQVCATLFNAKVKPKPGLISQTFTGSGSAFHSALAILNRLEFEDYLGPNGKIMEHSRYFMDQLRLLSEKHPQAISGPFGYGLMIAFQAFDGSKETSIAFVKKLYEFGLIGFIAGINPTRIRFLIPVGALSKADIDVAISVIKKTIQDADSN